MRLDGAPLIALSGPRMGGDERAFEEDFHRAARQTGIDALADEAVMHRVIGATDLDMMILMDFCADLPLGVFVTALGQCLCERPLFGIEDTLAAPVALLECSGIDVYDDLGDCGIEFREAEELRVAQSPEHGALGHEHSLLDRGLVAGFFYPRREHCKRISLRKIAV
jgi:hypothetical protein